MRDNIDYLKDWRLIDNINTAKQPDNIQRFLEILRTEMKKDYLPLQERIEKILDQARDEQLDTDGNEISQKVSANYFAILRASTKILRKKGRVHSLGP